jgi:Tfp pilus assembly protein PilE
MAALAIDSKHCIPQLQNYFDVVAGQSTTTGQVRKIYTQATIVHDAARIAAVQGALDHQADELEVFHYVNKNQHAETSSLLLELASPRPSTSAMSRPKREPHDLNIGFICGSPFRASDPSSRPEKRRRTAVSLEGDDRSEEKQFKGVRYRPDRKKWVAEMKPPKHGNKVSFGEFKSQEQAARVVDAAFYYYQKPHFLNFPESTSEVLASKPMPAGFDEKEKLVFVKEQAKWLASMDHSSTLSAAPVPPSSSSRSCSDFSDRCQGMLVIYHTYMSPPAPTIQRQFCEEPAQELLHQPWNESDGYAATLN